MNSQWSQWQSMAHSTGPYRIELWRSSHVTYYSEHTGVIVYTVGQTAVGPAQVQKRQRWHKPRLAGWWAQALLEASAGGIHPEEAGKNGWKQNRSHVPVLYQPKELDGPREKRTQDGRAFKGRQSSYFHLPQGPRMCPSWVSQNPSQGCVAAPNSHPV